MQQEGFCRNVVLLVISDLPDREVCVTVLLYLRGKTVEDLIQSCSLGRDAEGQRIGVIGGRGA